MVIADPAFKHTVVTNKIFLERLKTKDAKGGNMSFDTGELKRETKCN